MSVERDEKTKISAVLENMEINYNFACLEAKIDESQILKCLLLFYSNSYPLNANSSRKSFKFLRRLRSFLPGHD